MVHWCLFRSTWGDLWWMNHYLHTIRCNALILLFLHDHYILHFSNQSIFRWMIFEYALSKAFSNSLAMFVNTLIWVINCAFLCKGNEIFITWYSYWNAFSRKLQIDELCTRMYSFTWWAVVTNSFKRHSKRVYENRIHLYLVLIKCFLPSLYCKLDW